MLRIPLLIATFELRRTLRAILSAKMTILVWSIFGLMLFGGIFIFGVTVAPDLGNQVATGELTAVGGTDFATVATGAAAMAWAVLAVIATIRTVETAAKVDEPATLLIGTSVSNVVWGKFLASVILFLCWSAPAVLYLAAAFSYGAGSPWPVVLSAVALVVIVASAGAVGFLAGMAIRHLLTVYRPIARFRTPVLALLFIGYLGVVLAGWFDQLTMALFHALGQSPFGWPGHLLVVSIPTIEANSAAAFGAIITSGLLVAVAGSLTIVLANHHWFADSARSATGKGHSLFPHRSPSGGTDCSVTVEDPLWMFSRVFSQPTRTVAATTIRRTARAPVRLVYIGLPLLGGVFLIDPIIRAGEVPAYLAVVLCFYVIWGAGALFSLNPLGDHGPALPMVLTSTVSGRSLVAGRLLASAIILIPVALGVSIATGVLSPLSPQETVLLVGGTLLGVVISPAIALGVGSVYPRFGSVRVASNREAVMPSKTAFALYSTAISLPLGAGSILAFEPAQVGLAFVVSAVATQLPVIDTVAIQPDMVRGVAALALILGLALPIICLRRAVRALDSFSL